MCSADDFFVNEAGKYVYDVKKIGAAHEWALARAADMVARSLSPIVVDNTNTQLWEAKSYVEVAVAAGYAVEILQPQTEWAFNPIECAARNRHGVPEAAIRKMLQRWEENFTVERILQATQPPWVRPPSPVAGRAAPGGPSPAARPPPPPAASTPLEGALANLEIK